MKRIELSSSQPISGKAVAEALARVLLEPHKAWADLIVQPSRLREAMKIAREHNETKPEVQIRVMAETKNLGMNDWKLKTDAVEVHVLLELDGA